MKIYGLKTSLLSVLCVLTACESKHEADDPLVVQPTHQRIQTSVLRSMLVSPALAINAKNDVNDVEEKVNATAVSHCSINNETILFNCQIKEKVLSVCGLSDLQLSYRFGPPNAVEKRIDAKAVSAGQSFSGGYESRLIFTEGKFSYVVYDNLIKTMQDGKPTHVSGGGVYVVKSTTLLAQLSCDNYVGQAEMSSVTFTETYSPQKTEYVFYEDLEL